MKEIKGFQQFESKGKNMLRSEEGPWKIYQRGPSYRVGRKTWWGIKWLKDGPKGSLFPFRTDHLANAEVKLKAINEKAYDEEWYKDSKWETKK